MKKKISNFVISLIAIICVLNISNIGNSMEDKIFYDFKLELINGEKISLNEYKGKAVLLVNVASNCGFTKQFKMKSHCL